MLAAFAGTVHSQARKKSTRTFVFLGFEERNLGCPRNFAGTSRTRGGVQKVCAIKFVRIFRSLHGASFHVFIGPSDAMSVSSRLPYVCHASISLLREDAPTPNW